MVSSHLTEGKRKLTAIRRGEGKKSDRSLKAGYATEEREPEIQ